MLRGFMGGFVVGAAVSVSAAAIISLSSGPPEPPEVALAAPQGAEAPPDGAAPATPEPRPAEGDPRPAAADLSAPGAADGVTIADDVLRPALRPDTGEAAPGPSGPAPTTEPGGVAVADRAPNRPQQRAPAPSAPETDPGATVAIEPPRPSGTGLSPFQPLPGGLRAPADGEANGAVAPEADTAVAGMTGAPAPGVPGQPDQPDIAADPAPRPETEPPRMALAPTDMAAPEVRATDAEPHRDDTGQPRAVTTAPAMPSPESDAEARQDSESEDLSSSGGTDEAQAQPTDADTMPTIDSAPAPVPGPPGLSIGTPATSLLDRGTDDADISAEDTRDPAAEAEAGSDLSALRRNAEPFDNPDGQPLMSIILMDTGQNLEDGPIGLAALGSFPHPLTFAVDTRLPDAADRVARYRERGFEVMALLDLPRNLTASDTEVALPTLLGRMPEAVAVLEGPETGLQGSPEMAAQVAAILQETGHGVVWRPTALDTAQRNAAREGVASRTLYRDFDSDDQSPIVIRRFLDQAAFRAGQEGSVITVGRVRADTISALVVWGLQDRVRRVAVAPVSAVLSEDPGE